MRPIFDTIRSRIVAGLIPLSIGLVGTALLAAVTLRQMRHAVADELAGLRASSEIGSGLHIHRDNAGNPLFLHRYADQLMRHFHGDLVV